MTSFSFNYPMPRSNRGAVKRRSSHTSLKSMHGVSMPARLFRFCTDVLHLSEAEAYRRINAARLSRRFPVLLTMLEDDSIHLCGIAVISKHLTKDNCEEVFAKATHKSKRELEELVAELAPKPDVPPTIRKRPQLKAQAESSKASDEGREEPKKKPPTRPAAPEKRATVAPVSPASYLVKFTASAELRDKLERLEVKRFVWARDGGQCTFVTLDGKRCPERHRLEYHHDDPYGLGGDRSANNIRLMCKCHNLYMGELDYGKEKMDAFRRSADRAGEPAPSFQLSPGTVAMPNSA